MQGRGGVGVRPSQRGRVGGISVQGTWVDSSHSWVPLRATSGARPCRVAFLQPACSCVSPPFSSWYSTL